MKKLLLLFILAASSLFAGEQISINATGVNITAATQTTPWGFATQAQADALTTRINQLVADNANLITLVNELRAAQVEKGLIKGS